MSEDIKFPYQDFYFADWRMGCSGMTAQQEGLYIRLYTHLGSLNGRGLPNDFNVISRMVLDPSDEAEVVEQQKADLMFVINAKLTLVDGRYHQLRQKKDRENKVDIVKIRQETGKKGGLAKAKQTKYQNSSKDSDSDSESIYNNIWSKLSIRRGSKQVAYASWLKSAKDIKPEILIEKYNSLCSQADDPKFIPHFSTWLNQNRWEEELPIKKEETPVQPKTHKDYVFAVKKGMRLMNITDDMVSQMRKENLITEEEFKRW